MMVSLFHVRGTSVNASEQVEEKPSSMNSMDCFALVTPTHTYSWHATEQRSRKNYCR